MRPRPPEAGAASSAPAGAEPLGSDLAGWTRGIADAFDRAAASSGGAERRLRIAGAPVALRAAGPAMLERLGPALAHLADDSGDEPELTIHTWDSGHTAADPPLFDTAADEPLGAVFYSADDVRRVAYQPALGQLSAYDDAAHAAWFWCRSASDMPFWEPAAPFRQILHWWLTARGLLLLHGAAVGRAGGGVLLVGRGGSGKSTSALSTLRSSLLYAGDDYVAVEPGPEPAVASLYCSGKLEPGHAKLLPHLPPPSFDGDGSPDEKAVFYVSDRFPDRMSRGFPLRAVVAPRVVRGAAAPRVVPASAGEALAALAPSTLLQMRPAQPEALTRMAELLRHLPAYVLEVGGPVEQIPPAIEGLLDELGVR